MIFKQNCMGTVSP